MAPPTKQDIAYKLCRAMSYTSRAGNILSTSGAICHSCAEDIESGLRFVHSLVAEAASRHENGDDCANLVHQASVVQEIVVGQCRADGYIHPTTHDGPVGPDFERDQEHILETLDASMGYLVEIAQLLGDE